MRKLLLISAVATAISSAALAQGQSGSGWWDGWGGHGMWPGGQGMMPGYGGGPGWGNQGWNGPGWGGQSWGGQSWGGGMMQPDGGTPGGWMGAPGGGMGLSSIDANQDGTISAEEAASHAEFMFEAMDNDQDGALAPEEMGGGRMDMMRRMPSAMASAMEERHASRFATKDTDGDGKVTMAEFLVAEKAQFEAADTDNDGKVTPWELRAQMWQ